MSLGFQRKTSYSLKEETSKSFYYPLKSPYRICISLFHPEKLKQPNRQSYQMGENFGLRTKIMFRSFLITFLEIRKE